MPVLWLPAESHGLRDKDGVPRRAQGWGLGTPWLVPGLWAPVGQGSPVSPGLSSSELFRPPELHAVPSPKPHEGAPLTLRCQTEMHPQKSASRLLFSFLKNGHTLQDRDPRPELHLPEAREGDSGLYWCQATPEGSRVQKQSPRLEVRVLGEWGRRGTLPRICLQVMGPLSLGGGLPGQEGAQAPVANTQIPGECH